MVLKSGVLCSVKIVWIFVPCSSLEFFGQRNELYVYSNGHRWKFRQTINGHRSYRFPKAVCHKRHNYGESGSWLFRHIIAPADRSGLAQLHPQLFCLSDLSHYRLVCTTRFPEYESHVEGTQVAVCRRDKWGWYGVPLRRWRKPKLNPAVVRPLAEMCDSERKPGLKAVCSKSACGIK